MRIVFRTHLSLNSAKWVHFNPIFKKKFRGGMPPDPPRLAKALRVFAGMLASLAGKARFARVKWPPKHFKAKKWPPSKTS